MRCLRGSLASSRQAALPLAAALGGMFVPASIYFLMNGGGVEARGWAISMGTDIVFALGILALVAPQAPNGLKIFLGRRGGAPRTLPPVSAPTRLLR